ncbi:hypothetical protein CYMTET_37137, partial [Cymbomonas tetramitiformis]
FFEAPAAYEDGEHPADEGRGMQEAGGGQSLAGIPGFEPFTGPGTEVLVQLRLQCSAAALNDLLFPNDFSAETFQASLIDKAGGTPGNAEEWMPNAKGQHERKLQARIPATGLPGTFTTKYETQTYLIHEEERVYYVLTVTKTPDVPYGNCFVVETQNLIVADDSASDEGEEGSGAACYLYITFRVRFVTSTMMKSWITNATAFGTREHYKIYRREIAKSVTVLGEGPPPALTRAASLRGDAAPATDTPSKDGTVDQASGSLSRSVSLSTQRLYPVISQLQRLQEGAQFLLRVGSGLNRTHVRHFLRNLPFLLLNPLFLMTALVLEHVVRGCQLLPWGQARESECFLRPPRGAAELLWMVAAVVPVLRALLDASKSAALANSSAAPAEKSQQLAALVLPSDDSEVGSPQAADRDGGRSPIMVLEEMHSMRRNSLARSSSNLDGDQLPPYDRTILVYASVPEKLRQYAMVEEVFESERWQPFVGWGSTYPGHFLPHEQRRWCNRDRNLTSQKFEDLVDERPPDGWTWHGEWMVDMGGRVVDTVDAKGWYYAIDFPMMSFPPDAGSAQVGYWCCRMRRWVRIRTRVVNELANQSSPIQTGMTFRQQHIDMLLQDSLRQCSKLLVSFMDARSNEQEGNNEATAPFEELQKSVDQFLEWRE